MARAFPLAPVLVGAAAALMLRPTQGGGGRGGEGLTAPTALPAVTGREEMTLEAALRRRRSIRSYAERSLSVEEIAHLLWAAQGVTDRSSGGRTAPSAGALYPIEVYVATAEGVDRYLPEPHAIARIAAGDRRAELGRAALDQPFVRRAAANVVIVGVPERTERKYGARAERYVLLEAGHVGQNVLLEAVALELGAVPVGAFDEDEVARILRLPRGERPLYIVAVGALTK